MSLAGPPGRRQGLCAGQRLGEGLPLTGKLLTKGPEPQYRADAHSVSHCWINGNISTSAITKSSVFLSGWYRIVTRDKGEVEEEEEREDVKRCRWQ